MRNYPITLKLHMAVNTGVLFHFYKTCGPYVVTVLYE